MKAFRFTLSLLPVLALSVWAVRVQAADVEGKLILATYTPAADKGAAGRPYNWETGNGFKETAPDRVDAARQLAVVLVGKGGDAEKQLELSFQGGGLLPATIVVRPGTAVRITNTDEIAHELYAEGLEGFSAEATAPRRMRSVAMRETGNWPLRDRLIPHLRGHLHVISDLVARATINARGQFVFKGVAPGDYELRVLHGPDTIASKRVTVGDRGLTVDALPLSAPAATK